MTPSAIDAWVIALTAVVTLVVLISRSLRTERKEWLGQSPEDNERLNATIYALALRVGELESQIDRWEHWALAVQRANPDLEFPTEPT